MSWQFWAWLYVVCGCLTAVVGWIGRERRLLGLLIIVALWPVPLICYNLRRRRQR